jgi:hypothetical protein
VRFVQHSSPPLFSSYVKSPSLFLFLCFLQVKDIIAAAGKLKPKRLNHPHPTGNSSAQSLSDLQAVT